MTLIGGGAALADSQTDNAPVVATTTTHGVTVAGGLQSQTQGVGNVLTVSAPVGTFTTAGDTQTVGANPISATSTLRNSTVSGISSVSSLAEGNDMEVNPTNTISYSNGGPSSTQTTDHGGPITAATRVKHVEFTGDTTVSAAAIGNNYAASSQSGTVGFWASQGNDAAETATVVLHNTNVAGGALSSVAQAVGNSVSAGGLLNTANYNAVSQENRYAGQTATQNLSGDNLLSTGNTVLASAEGNVASLGQPSSLFGASQDNAAGGETATVNLQNATVNGDFSAQAAGNVLSFDATNGSTIVEQNDRAPSTSNMNVSGPVVLNASATFGSLAVGNQFSGTLSPLVNGVPDQQSSAAIDANSSISGVQAQGFGAAVNTTAAGNLASLTTPGGFSQVNTGAPTAIASISGSSFGGGLTVATAALGNSISIK